MNNSFIHTVMSLFYVSHISTLTYVGHSRRSLLLSRLTPGTYVFVKAALEQSGRVVREARQVVLLFALNSRTAAERAGGVLMGQMEHPPRLHSLKSQFKLQAGDQVQILPTPALQRRIGPTDLQKAARGGPR